MEHKSEAPCLPPHGRQPAAGANFPTTPEGNAARVKCARCMSSTFAMPLSEPGGYLTANEIESLKEDLGKTTLDATDYPLTDFGKCAFICSHSWYTLRRRSLIGAWGRGGGGTAKAAFKGQEAIGQVAWCLERQRSLRPQHPSHFLPASHPALASHFDPPSHPAPASHPTPASHPAPASASFKPGIPCMLLYLDFLLADPRDDLVLLLDMFDVDAAKSGLFINAAKTDYGGSTSDEFAYIAALWQRAAGG
eukprot:364518-Chlamydomonas_euryale.AAC.4